MSEIFYRAEFTLEEVKPYPDGNGYNREHTTTVAEIVVTGSSAADAVYQMREHVGQLQKWHAAAESASRPPAAEGSGTPEVDHG